MTKLIFCFTLFSAVVSMINALDGSLSAGVAGTSTTDDNIFELKALNYPVTVKRMDIHMAATQRTIQVWYRPGSQTPVYVDTYVQALSQSLTGNGMGNLTSLSSFSTPIVIPANTTYTFYVTTSTNNANALYFEDGILLGQAHVSDEFLVITEGYALKYSFSTPVFPRRWNGMIYYSTTAPAPTPGSPTKNPTALPTNQATLSPTKKQASSISPTRKPTFSPTKKPTFSPTKKSASSSPTRISAFVDTMSPTLTEIFTLKPTSLTPSPTKKPVSSPPTKKPTSSSPTKKPTSSPTKIPITSSPAKTVTTLPTNKSVSSSPTKTPITLSPTSKILTSNPTKSPVSFLPTKKPAISSYTPTKKPVSYSPTKKPVSYSPTKKPVIVYTSRPTVDGNMVPTFSETLLPTAVSMEPSHEKIIETLSPTLYEPTSSPSTTLSPTKLKTISTVKPTKASSSSSKYFPSTIYFIPIVVSLILSMIDS